MNYTKRFLWSFSLCLVPMMDAAMQYGEKNWRDLLNPENNTRSVDRNELLDEYGKEVKKLFDLDSLSIEQKNIVFNMRKNCYGVVFALIAQKQYNSTSGVLFDMPHVAGQCFAQWAAAQAQNVAQNYLQSKYGMFSSDLIKKAQESAYKKALSDASTRKKGCLQYIVNGRLEDAIKAEIDAEMAARKPAQKKEKEIFELYPADHSTGLSQVRTNIENKQQIRNDECPVCLEEYKDIARRANLPCRHDICPCDLLEIMYKNGNSKCPQCRKEISKNDFPREYLEKECRKQKTQQ